MPVVGALAAALALFGAQLERADVPGTERAQARMLASRLVVPPVPGRAYVTGLVEAISPHDPAPVNGPAHDGMSLRELRPVDLSGQVMLPLLAGRF